VSTPLPFLSTIARVMGCALLTLAALSTQTGSASAQPKAAKRLALVIGNGNYQTVPQLPNAGNDADATADMLQEARFDVSRIADSDLAALRSGVESFALAVERAGQGAIAVVYYAGHAVQLNGNNHLLPVDVRPQDEADLAIQSVTLGEILKRLDRTGASAKILILDACRDNPFDKTVAPARGLAVALLDNPGKAEAGLARVESKGGTFVAFATSPGTSAADGIGQHSPFTQALLRYAREPGVEVETVFRNVRLAVHDVTAGRQIPWETSSLTTPVAFFESSSLPSVSLQQVSTDTALSSSRGGGPDPAPEPTRDGFEAMTPSDAYTLAVAWDRPEYYRLFLEVFGDDPLALRVHRILSMRIEEMSWAMAARWGDPAHLRRYASVFSGSAHALEARAMAAAGGAPGAKSAAVCTPAQPKGLIDGGPMIRKASVKPALAKSVAARSAAPRPRVRPTVEEIDEVEPYGIPPVIVAPFVPGIFIRAEPMRRPPAVLVPGGTRPLPRRETGPSSGLTQAPEDTAYPGFARFIDAGRSRAGISRNELSPVARPAMPAQNQLFQRW
jgi:uncharacterized caspase-like protein